jgi:hypothetical protein
LTSVVIGVVAREECAFLSLSRRSSRPLPRVSLSRRDLSEVRDSILPLRLDRGALGSTDSRREVETGRGGDLGRCVGVSSFTAREVADFEGL